MQRYNPPLAERMKRRLFNLAAATSLLLCVGTVALWVRSRGNFEYFHYGWPEKVPGNRGYERIFSNKGIIGYVHCVKRHPQIGSNLWYGYGFEHERMASRQAPPGSVFRGRQWRGFGYMHESFNAPDGAIQFWAGGIYCPHWFLALLLLTLPLQQVVAAQRARLNRQRDLCECCGYDLRESPDRCPECGTPNPAPLKPRSPLQSPAG
jgi:hypothetical protein